MLGSCQNAYVSHFCIKVMTQMLIPFQILNTMLTLSVKMLAFLTIDKKGSLWLNTDTKASLHLCFMLAASRMILYSCSADEALLMTIAVSARDARPRF